MRAVGILMGFNLDGSDDIWSLGRRGEVSYIKGSYCRQYGILVLIDGAKAGFEMPSLWVCEIMNGLSGNNTLLLSPVIRAYCKRERKHGISCNPWKNAPISNMHFLLCSVNQEIYFWSALCLHTYQHTASPLPCFEEKGTKGTAVGWSSLIASLHRILPLLRSLSLKPTAVTYINDQLILADSIKKSIHYQIVAKNHQLI